MDLSWCRIYQIPSEPLKAMSYNGLRVGWAKDTKWAIWSRKIVPQKRVEACNVVNVKMGKENRVNLLNLTNTQRLNTAFATIEEQTIYRLT